MKRKDTRSYDIDKRLLEDLLEWRHEPGFRYCVDAIDNPASHDGVEEYPDWVGRLALVEYPVRLYGNVTITPPTRHLLYRDNTPTYRLTMWRLAERLNEIACRFEARMRGVANPGKPSDADRNERDERKEAAR